MTLDEALSIDVDTAWPCKRWCWTVSPTVDPTNRCDCGRGTIRDTITALRDEVRRLRGEVYGVVIPPAPRESA